MQIISKFIWILNSKFNLQIQIPQDIQFKEKYINFDFRDYDLPYYESYVKLINGIAYHKDFYMILPHLLRSFFENLLQDIFSQSLTNSSSDLYYYKRGGRKSYINFSKLIKLLDELKDDEFGHLISGKITKTTIKELENIREKGNISIHDIGEKISPKDVLNMRDTMKITLEPLLITYKKLKGKDISVGNKRKYNIKVKLGLIKEEKKDNKPNSKRKKKKNQLYEISVSEISTLMSEIRLLIDNDSPDYMINLRRKMDDLLLKVKSLNLNNRQRDALRKAYILFNSTLQTKPPMKKTLQTLFDAINIIIL